MRSVVAKTVDQQASGIILKHLEMLIGQRMQAINALRGHAAEFGVVAAKGTGKVATLLSELAADPAIPATAWAMSDQMASHIEALDQRLAAADAELVALHKAEPLSRMLAEIPGVGPVGAITMVPTVQPENFASARHFAAWLVTDPRCFPPVGARVRRMTRRTDEAEAVFGRADHRHSEGG